jgi:hypothetical protein
MDGKLGISRRRILRGLTAAGTALRIGLPPLDSMFNSHGTAYAAQSKIPSRFVLWFNGNGIPERYWIPAETGPEFQITPCLSPLAQFRDQIHVLSGLDNPAARMPGPGNDHHRSMSGLMSGTPFTGRGAGGPSIDQVIASKIGTSTRFGSLQIGVCQESHGESIHRNMSWAGYERALPPELVPQNLFDRIFGTKPQDWLDRKKSVLDAVRDDFSDVSAKLGSTDKTRLDGYLSSIRDLERAILSLPPEYGNKEGIPPGGDVKDYPRIAKLQSELLVHALASGQTNVATYMLTKCQSLVRLPWLGYTTLRHHDYTHTNADSPRAQRILRDICRWHVEEFAYLMAKLASIREGDGTLLDNCCLAFIHEHAEANAHKNNGLAAILAGHKNLIKGRHTKTTGTMAELYLALGNDVVQAGLDRFPTAGRKLEGIAVT